MGEPGARRAQTRCPAPPPGRASAWPSFSRCDELRGGPDAVSAGAADPGLATPAGLAPLRPIADATSTSSDASPATPLSPSSEPDSSSDQQRARLSALCGTPPGAATARLRPATPRRPSSASRRGSGCAHSGAGVDRAEGTGETRGPAHGVRGGGLRELYECWVVRGRVPDRRRPVHPPARPPPDRHGKPSPWTGTSPAGWPRACSDGPRTRRSPGSPVATCPTAAPGCTPRPCAIHALNPGTGVEKLIPHFKADPISSARSSSRVRGAARQRGDCSADLQADPPGLRYDGSWTCLRRPRVRPGGRVEPDPRMGEIARRSQSLRDLTTPVRADDDHRVPPPVAAAPSSSVGIKPEESPRRRTRPSRSASPACSPGASSARRTARAG